jgi:hypothetical protein
LSFSNAPSGVSVRGAPKKETRGRQRPRVNRSITSPKEIRSMRRQLNHPHTTRKAQPRKSSPWRPWTDMAAVSAAAKIQAETDSDVELKPNAPRRWERRL